MAERPPINSGGAGTPVPQESQAFPPSEYPSDMSQRPFTSDLNEGLERKSFEKSRSLPLQQKTSNEAEPKAESQPVLQSKESPTAGLHRSSSGVNLVPKTSKELEDEFVTRHMLYKEALYTGVHFLGKPSERFPCDKEKVCLYVHEAFSTSPQEQQAVIDHVKGELYPIIGVNTKILKAEGLRHHHKDDKIPNPYCVVAIEREGTKDKAKDWQRVEQSSDTPLQKFRKVVRRSTIKEELVERRAQNYDDIPAAHRTVVVPHEKNPEWNQSFQVISMHPLTDSLIVEVWDHVDDDTLQKSADAYRKANAVSTEETPRRSSKGDSKQSDIFMGRVHKMVADISCEGTEKGIHLEAGPGSTNPAHGKIKIRLWLIHLYRHGKPAHEMVEKKTMLACLWDWVLSFENKRLGKNWDGKLPVDATCLLYQYALQRGIGEETHSVIRYNAYAKHKADLEGMGQPLQDIDHLLTKRLSSGKPRVIENQLAIEESIITLVEEEIFPIIKNHLNEEEERVIRALTAYKSCQETLSKLEVSYALEKIEGLFEKALRLCFLEWYQNAFVAKVEVVGTSDKCQIIKAHVELVMEVNLLVEGIAKEWNEKFITHTEYNSYIPIMYDELQKMVTHDVETACFSFLQHYDDNQKLRQILIRSSKEDECMASAFFALYSRTQEFADMQKVLLPENLQYETLGSYYKWFRPLLTLWLGFAVIRGSDLIISCVNVDNVAVHDVQNLTSTSALDTAAVIHQLVNFWDKLKWPDPSEGYVVIHFILEVICFFTVLYAIRKLEKLEMEGYFDTVGRFDVSEPLCVCLNNIEYVKDVLESIPEEVKYSQLITDLEETCGVTRETIEYRQRMKQTITITLANVDLIFSEIMKGLRQRVKPEVRRSVEETLYIIYNLNQPDKQMLNEALDPILSHMDRNIVTLYQSLMPLNFARLLQLFWNIVLEEMDAAVWAFKGIRSAPEQKEFVMKVTESVPIFKEYFQNGDGGLDDAEIETLEYLEFQINMNLVNKSTDDVIRQYYETKGREQMEIDMKLKTKRTQFGMLRTKIGYAKGNLSVEIIEGVELVPMDITFSLWSLCKNNPRGSSDPFVEIELQPSHIFKHPKVRKTRVHKKTLNPAFHESFQWDLSPEEAIKEGAVILFSVKDWDMITRNDFMGEAVVPLTEIPGVSQSPISQPMHLHLRSVQDNPILNVLKSRKWDNQAQRFYDLQVKRRVVIDS